MEGSKGGGSWRPGVGCHCGHPVVPGLWDQTALGLGPASPGGSCVLTGVRRNLLSPIPPQDGEKAFLRAGVTIT